MTSDERNSVKMRLELNVDCLKRLRSRIASKKHLHMLKLHYLLFFAGQAILLPFIPMLQKSYGLTAKETCVINGTMPFFGFFAVYGISCLADKLRKHRVILVSLCVLCALAHLLLKAVPTNDYTISESVKQLALESRLTCSESGTRINEADRLQLFTAYDGTDLLECHMKCPGVGMNLINAAGVSTPAQTVNVDFQVHLVRTSALPTIGDDHESNLLMDGIYVGQTYVNITCATNSNKTCQTTCVQPEEQVPQSESEFGLTFWIFFTVYFFAHLLYSPCTSLCDAMAYQLLPQREHEYGKQRCFGTLGFILASGLNSLIQYFSLFPDEGNYDHNIYIFTMLLIVAAIPAFFIRAPEQNLVASDDENTEEFEKGMTAEKQVPACELLKDVRVWTLVIAMLIFGLNFGLVFAFLFWYMSDLQFDVDFDTQFTVMGLALGVAGGMELFFMIVSGYIVRKMGELNCLVVSFLAYGLRFFLYSKLDTFGSIWCVLPIEVLYGPSFGLMFAAATSYANKISPPGLQATLQGLASGFHFNIGWGIGALLGGVIYTTIGGSKMFLCFSILSVAAACCLGLMSFYLRKYVRGPTSSVATTSRNVLTDERITSPIEGNLSALETLVRTGRSEN